MGSTTKAHKNKAHLQPKLYQIKVKSQESSDEAKDYCYILNLREFHGVF